MIAKGCPFIKKFKKREEEEERRRRRRRRIPTGVVVLPRT